MWIQNGESGDNDEETAEPSKDEDEEMKAELKRKKVAHTITF